MEPVISNPRTGDDFILGLDIGEVRIGVALANGVARIASPLTCLNNSQSVNEEIKQLVTKHNARAIVAGLPRNLQGQETSQTRYTSQFIELLRQSVGVPIFTQDEALTSRKAEEELEARKKPYAKGDVDALAASYILADFLNEGKDW